MITQRFQSLLWVGGVALAALLLYIVSLQVATERGRLQELDRQVIATQREIRQLQTELGTRANLRQLEQWNGAALALSSPNANQFLNSEEDISMISAKNLGAAKAPPPSMTAVFTPKAEEIADPASAAPQVADPAQLTSQDLQVQKELGVAPLQQKMAAVQPARTQPKSGGQSQQ